MTTTDVPRPIRVSGPQGLLAAIPVLLGFHPAESLVMVCLSAARGRVGPIARIDIPPPEQAGDAAAQLAGHARRHAQRVAVVCYTRIPGRPYAFDVLLDTLDDAGVPLLAAFTVREGVARFAGSEAIEADDPGFAVPGTGDPQVSELAAASVLSGRAVLRDRESLRRSIAAPAGRRRTAALRAMTAAAAELSAEVDGLSGPDISSELVQRAMSAMDAARTQMAESGRVAPATAAMLILLSCDIQARDALVARSVGGADPGALPLFISIATQAPAEDAAEICAVLAVVAYRNGDGALAQLAVDRTLATEPAHRLAQLMLSVMAAGLPPAELAGLAVPPTRRVNPGKGAGRRRR